MNYSEPASPTASKSGSRVRALGLLLGGLALFAVGFNLLERLVAPDSAPVAVPTAEHRSDPIEPIRPQVRKVGSDGVAIDAGELRRTTIVIDGSSEDVDLLLACLEEGIEQSFSDGGSFVPPGSDGWLTRRAHRRAIAKHVSDEIDRIKDQCMQSSVHRRTGRRDHGRPRD